MSNRWHLIIQETLLDPETKYLVQFASNEESANRQSLPDVKKQTRPSGLRCNWTYTDDAFVYTPTDSGTNASQKRYTRESLLELYSQELEIYTPPVEFILSYGLHKVAS